MLVYTGPLKYIIPSVGIWRQNLSKNYWGSLSSDLSCESFNFISVLPLVCACLTVCVGLGVCVFICVQAFAFKYASTELFHCQVWSKGCPVRTLMHDLMQDLSSC